MTQLYGTRFVRLSERAVRKMKRKYSDTLSGPSHSKSQGSNKYKFRHKYSEMTNVQFSVQLNYFMPQCSMFI